MKNKSAIIIVSLIVVVGILSVVFFINQNKLDGSTIESREQILRDLPKGIEWHISSEIKIDDYIISSVVSSNKVGIAVFEPEGNGSYKYQTISYRDNGEIVIAQAIINDTSYNLFWLNQSDLEYADLIYTVQGSELEPIRLDAKGLNVLYSKAPSNNYSMSVTYYDAQGNAYK